MTKTMKAAVVREFGKPLDHRRGAGARAGSRRDPGGDPRLGRLPHRPARRRGRLAGQADPAVHPRPRGRRLRLGRRRGRPPCQGGRPGRRAVALHRLRPLPALPRRLGDALREPAEHRLFGERRLRGIRGGRPELYRSPAAQPRFRRDRPGALRRRHRLQGPEGHRHQARRLGGDLGHRRARPHGRAVCPRHGPERRRGRYRRRQARPRAPARRDRHGQRDARGPGHGHQARDRRRRPGRAGDRGRPQGLRAGAGHGRPRRHRGR